MIKKLVLFLAIFLLAFGAVSTIQGQETAIITINANSVIGQIPPLAIGGQNIGVYVVHDLKEEFKALNIPLLRFPAGNRGDEHDYSGRLTDQYVWKASLMEIKELMIQARLFGGVFGRGTADEAADWVAYAKEKGYNIRYWEIGNEPDLYATQRRGPSWTPEKYCQEFREYYQAMKAVNPDIKIAGPAISNPKDEWIKTFLAECGDIVDILSWHWWPTDGLWPDEEALATVEQIEEIIQKYRSWTKDSGINPKGYDRDIKLMISEFGLSWRSQLYTHIADMTSAIWLADVLGRFAKNSLDISTYFSLQNEGGHGLIDNAKFRRPTYYTFLIYTHYGNKELEASSDKKILPAYASLTEDNKLSIIIINKDPEVSYEGQISIKGFKPEGRATVWSHIEESVNNFALSMEEIEVRENFVYTFPPYSVSCLVIE